MKMEEELLRETVHALIREASDNATPKLNVMNEKMLASQISKLAKKARAANKSLTVVIEGANKSLTIENVTGAVAVGGVAAAGGTGNKSDVDIITSEGKKGISLKLPSADYWESAETTLGRIIGPKIEKMVAKGKQARGKRARGPKIDTQEVKYGKNDEFTHTHYVMVGSNNQPLKKIWWELDEEMADKAVFGTPRVNAVIVTDFTKTENWSLSEDKKVMTLTWESAGTKIYETLDDLDDKDKPVGLLRIGTSKEKAVDYLERGEAGKIRGLTYGKDDMSAQKYSGLRPMIARKGFVTGAKDVEQIVI